jgi:sulfite reductase (NADPH) hemoprotein beta-component
MPGRALPRTSIVDTRPFAEITRQWSTLHPEFAFLPRKFKIAFNGAEEDRAATGWYDIGLQALKNDAGEVGFTVKVGGGMGRTPIIGSGGARIPALGPELLNYIEAVDPRVQRLRPARQQVEGAHQDSGQGRGPGLHRRGGERIPAIVEQDGAPHTITQAELDRVAANFVVPPN